MKNNELFVFEGKEQKRRPATKLICPICGKEFIKANHLINSDAKKGINVHYCSKECVTQAHTKQTEVACAYCGKSFYRRNSAIRSKSGLLFCSRNCKDIAQKITSDKKFDIMRPAHYNTGISDYRAIAFINKEAKCERCGYSENIAALQVHHKDHDRKNNDPSNLEILCANCHAIEHLGKK